MGEGGVGANLVRIAVADICCIYACVSLYIYIMIYKDNVPYNLAKRIIVFVSNEEKAKYRLNELLELFVMQDYKVQHRLKQILKIFHL